MKKQIAILGSTGSIGKSLINIIRKDKKKYKIVLLSANKNYYQLIKQAREFNVKNIIISNKKNFEKIKKKQNMVILIFLQILSVSKKFLKKKLIILCLL